MNRKLAVMLFVVFVVADVVLVAAVMRHVQSEPASSDPTRSTPVASPATPTAGKVTGPMSLATGSDGLLARVTRGRCTTDGRPRLDLSSDDARTFDEVALPVVDGADTMRTLLAVRAESVSDLTIVGGDRECKTTAFRTENSGESWEKISTSDIWFVDAAGTGVVSPTTSTEPGCEVLSVSPFSDRNAKVLCADGLVRGTDDSGEEWVTLGELGEATAGTFWDLRQGIAIAPDGECDARAFETNDAGLQWTPAGCVAKDATVSSLAGTPDRLYALAGSRVLTSTDGGQTWERAQD